MNEKVFFLLTVCGSFLHSIITSLIIMKSKTRFLRNIIHIPYGFTGGLISKHNINYGFIYFSLISIYQIVEEIGNLVMYKKDQSWYDIEGYIIGFSYYVLFSILKNKYVFEKNSSSSSIITLETL
mgnify:CR=1 FL=1|jgi:hypothetical protein